MGVAWVRKKTKKKLARASRRKKDSHAVGMAKDWSQLKHQSSSCSTAAWEKRRETSAGCRRGQEKKEMGGYFPRTA